MRACIIDGLSERFRNMRKDKAQFEIFQHSIILSFQTLLSGNGTSLLLSRNFQLFWQTTLQMKNVYITGKNTQRIFDIREIPDESMIVTFMEILIFAN